MADDEWTDLDDAEPTEPEDNGDVAPVQGEAVPEPGPSAPSPTPGVRVCQVDGCDNLIPADAHGARKYCFDHWTGSATARKQRERRKPAERPESNKLGGPPKRATRPAELAVVEANAKRLLEGGAAIIVLASRRTADPLREQLVADAVDVQQGADPMAHAIRGVAAHEQWLRKILGGGGPISDRAIAWIGLGVVTVSVTMPIWIRHGWLPAEISQMAESLLQQQPPAPAADEPTDQPAPAAA